MQYWRYRSDLKKEEFELKATVACPKCKGQQFYVIDQFARFKCLTFNHHVDGVPSPQVVTLVEKIKELIKQVNDIEQAKRDK